jgi:hypothetical protein
VISVEDEQIAHPVEDDASARPVFIWTLLSTSSVWCLTNAPAEVAGLSDDTHYRKKLADRHNDFLLLHDISKAQKHVKLIRGAPAIAEAKQISTRPVGYGEGPYGHGRYGGPPQVVIDIDTSTMRYVRQIVDSALQFLEGELTRLTC